MSEARIAIRYARSLIELAQERGKLEKIHSDIQLLKKVLNENRQLDLILRNPVIKKNKKRIILEKIFKGKIDEMTLAAFDLILAKNRFSFLTEIVRQFNIQYNDVVGIQIAELTTAVPATEEMKREIREIISRIADKEDVRLKEIVDKSIIGGYKLVIGDKQIDDTLSTKLHDIKRKLTENKYIRTL